METDNKEKRQNGFEKLLRINPERKPLTVEKLRELSGLHDLSDEKAQEIIFTIRTFCFVLLELAKEKEQPATVSIEPNTNQLRTAA